MQAIKRAIPKNSPGPLTVLAALFYALRLAGVTDWQWWWVLAPLWTPWLVTVIAVIAVIAVVRLQARRAMRRSLAEFASSRWPGSAVEVMRRRDVRRVTRRRDVRRLLARGASGPSDAEAAGIPGLADFGEIFERHLRDQGWSLPEDPQ
jgi:hypothetical protein